MNEELEILYDHYRGIEYDANSWFAYEAALSKRVCFARIQQASDQDLLRDVSERCRSVERNLFNAAMSNPHKANYFAFYGKDAVGYVWRDVYDLASNNPEYVSWMVHAGEIQTRLEAYPGVIEKLEQRLNKVGEEARRLALNAGEVLLEVRDLERSLES